MAWPAAGDFILTASQTGSEALAIHRTMAFWASCRIMVLISSPSLPQSVHMCVFHVQTAYHGCNQRAPATTAESNHGAPRQTWPGRLLFCALADTREEGLRLLG